MREYQLQMIYLIAGELILLLGLMATTEGIVESHKEIMKLTSEFTSYVVFSVAVVIIVLTWPFWIVRSLLRHATNSKSS